MFTAENITFATLVVVIVTGVLAGPRLAAWWGQGNRSYRKAMADAKQTESKP